jgi:arylsulfatase A-like enzyme
MISGATRSGAWRALVLGQALALVFLAACLSWVWREIEYILPANLVTGSFGFQDALHSRLGWQLGAFFAALLVCHSMLGLAAFGLARLTRAAWPAAGSESLLTAGWFFALTGLVLAVNTTLFPASIFAGTDSWWRGNPAGILPVVAASLALAVVVAAFAARVLPRLAWRWTARNATVVASIVTILALIWMPRIPVFAAHGGGGPPNIVILGIDALRNDLVIPRRGPADAPNIRGFIDESRRFNDALTPLARTYPSWTTILTGRHPVTTNARFNLMPRRLVHEGETLATALRSRGYRAIYATDEVRYANFDQTYGFDQLITPPIGAIDFLLGYGADMPLVNLVASTPLGGLLFPSNHANRAASVTYRPRDFVQRLERDIDVNGPAFIAIHLTLAHWPYSWAGKRTPTDPAAYRIAYGEAVPAVDRQFADVLKMLEGKGVLDNAIVVLLSDHGEALGAENDSIIRQTGTSQEIWDSLWGHGTSVLSPNQYHVLLAMRAFGRARLPGPDQDYDWPVSLEDVRPTLEELATGATATGVDGLSLAPYMTEPGRATALANRVRFTETDLNTVSIRAGRYKASGIVSEAADYYELEANSGWVQLRETRLAELLPRKQRAAISSGSLLAAIPTERGDGVTYLYADRQHPVPRVLGGPGKPFGDPEARRLRDALQTRFPGELPPAT